MSIWVTDAIDKQVPDYQSIIQESLTTVRDWLVKRLDEISKEKEVVDSFENFLSTVPDMLESESYNSEVVEGSWDIFTGFHYDVRGGTSLRIEEGITDSVKDALRKGLLLGAEQFYTDIGLVPFKVNSLSGEAIIDMTFVVAFSTLDSEYEGTHITLFDNRKVDSEN